MKGNKGITLIALIITIIILIILAGISIAVLTGEDGLITKSKQARQNMENATIEEQTRLNTLYAEMDSQLTTGSTNNSGTPVNQGGSGSGLTAEEHQWLQQLATGNAGGGFTQEDHNALMSISSMPARGDINPLKNAGIYVTSDLSYNGQGSNKSLIPIKGYDKVSIYHKGNTSTIFFCDENQNNLGTLSFSQNGRAWSTYQDIPTDACYIYFCSNSAWATLSYSLLTADSPYNPDNQ